MGCKGSCIFFKVVKLNRNRRTPALAGMEGNRSPHTALSHSRQLNFPAGCSSELLGSKKAKPGGLGRNAAGERPARSPNQTISYKEQRTGGR